ncbi:MAG: 50S ribosomal protein L11 methyltransferase [Pyrinomonadaceae bacterium]
MDSQKKWFAVDIAIDAAAAETVEFALNEAGALGTEIDIFGGKNDLEILTVVGYFNEKPDGEILQNELVEALRIYDLSSAVIKKIEWREVENKDWLEEWKKHWKPTIAGKFIIAPTWEKVKSTNKIVIRIEPSMAFGTGTHETTRLCLKAIEENYLPGMSFFDVGTGTGILAIAALKLKSRVQSPKSGVNNIAGCDTDEHSIKIARENAATNEAGEIEFYAGTIIEETPLFDFVCANLTADVIVPLLPLLVKKFRRFLILSGILKEQENSVVEELRKFRIENPQIESDGEWISIQVKR